MRYNRIMTQTTSNHNPESCARPELRKIAQTLLTLMPVAAFASLITEGTIAKWFLLIFVLLLAAAGVFAYGFKRANEHSTG